MCLSLLIDVVEIVAGKMVAIWVASASLKICALIALLLQKLMKMSKAVETLIRIITNAISLE